MMSRPGGYSWLAHSRATAAVFSIAALVVSCDGGTTEPQVAAMNVHLPSSAADTIETRLLQPLGVVVVDQDGKPVPGIPVRFESLDRSPHSSYPGTLLHHVSLGRIGSDDAVTALTEVTDAAGRAAVAVRFGIIAGVARVRISSSQRGLVDTATFTVGAGAPFRAKFVGADTALHLGASAALAVSVVDRAGNPAPSPNFTISRQEGALAVSGTTVTAVAFGTGMVHVAASTFSDSVRVTVVPAGRLVVVQDRANPDDRDKVWLLDMDLSRKRLLGGPSSIAQSSRAPSWSPSGRLALQLGYLTFFVDTASGEASRAIQYPVSLRAEHTPEYTKDGSWVYFSGVPGSQNAALWRMRSDGTEAAQVGPAVDFYDVDAQPSPSPDGTRVVYWTNRTYRDTQRPAVRVLTVATGEVVDLGVSGTEPRWSPVSDDIVYRDGSTLRLMKADGTGQRVIGNSTGGYSRPPRWSPDGQWVIAQGGTGLHVINVSSGLILRLPPSTARYGELAWRP